MKNKRYFKGQRLDQEGTITLHEHKHGEAIHIPADSHYCTDPQVAMMCQKTQK